MLRSPASSSTTTVTKPVVKASVVPLPGVSAASTSFTLSSVGIQQQPIINNQPPSMNNNKSNKQRVLISVNESILDDSLSLPMSIDRFDHNYPPFLKDVVGFGLVNDDKDESVKENLDKEKSRKAEMDKMDAKKKVVWKSRADAVKRAFSHAWDGYVKYAWDEDELKPTTKRGDSWLHMGLTILDALDTAHVLQNSTIFNKAADWITNSTRPGLQLNADVNANVFETTIRVVGGLLSAHHLSGGGVGGLEGEKGRFLREAVRVADYFLPAFEQSKSGIPLNSIHLKTGKPNNPGGTHSSTAEATTIQLEFKYLTYLTNDPKYWNAAQRVSQVLYKSPTDKTDAYDNLVPVYMDPTTGNFVGQEIRLGSRADSYYEYLSKQYLLTNQTEPFFLMQYRKALHKGIKKHLLMRSDPSNLLYIREHNGDLKTGSKSEKFDHLVCYFGGTLALTATKGKRVPSDLEARKLVLTGLEMEELYMAEELAQSCYEMYHQTATGLAPEIVFWNAAKDQISIKKEFEKTWASFELLDKETRPSGRNIPKALETVKEVPNGEIERDFQIHALDKHNLLRPEAIETFFVLYRITGDEKYREWGWRMFRSFEQWSKVESGGYTSLDNVNVLPPPSRDKMESFYLGETLKYFYLLFSDDEALLPLDKYVFNTECHPFPIFEVGEELKKKDSFVSESIK
ncbi:UNVERIFIED_CONTAM: mannosyl-oligosaccharide alpha-1,2-mannosidase [Siphonaria sp. JEL0065]|nr:mannosyl-oligosaccharide alpha-1,2-mannosidase [Siphonaria sp. JEL0065]